MTFLMSDVFPYKSYFLKNQALQTEYYSTGDCKAETVATWLSLWTKPQKH